MAACVTSIRPFFDICLFFSHSVSLLLPPLSSSLSPHYYCQNSLIMKYCYCMTARMGHEGEQGEAGCETANHKEEKTEKRRRKKRCEGWGGGLGFQLRHIQWSCHRSYHSYHHQYRHCVWCVFVFVRQRRVFPPVCWWGN